MKLSERAERINKAVKSTGHLENICKIVTSEDFQEIAKENSVIIGLHTCGDLAANSLRLFAENVKIKGIINVGCCYHHLTEFVSENCGFQEYLNSVGEGAGGKLLDETLTLSKENAGYPLSGYVRSFEHFFLGRLSRSLCIGDSREKNSKKAILNFKKLEYRAAFQVFLSEHFQGFDKVFMLGNKIRKFTDFSDYCMQALQRMSIKSPLTCDEINDYYRINFVENEKKISILWLLRSVLSGAIENLIILDRILYLKEQGFEVEGVSVFDRKISPRNIAICAFRQ